MNTSKFALTAVNSYRRLQEAVRPVDRKVAKAEFDGICKAADALDLPNVMTPMSLHLAVMDAWQAGGIRPSYRPVDNSAQQEWDREVADAVVAALQW